MVKNIKKAVELLYRDRCNIYEKKVVSGVGRTTFEKVLKYSSVPCRISAKAYLFGENAAKENHMMTKVIKKAKLFLPPEYDVKEGSLIEVTSCNKTRLYGKSGAVNFYATHNEVMIELMKDYA